MPDDDRRFEPCFVEVLSANDGRVRVDLKFLLKQMEQESRAGELQLRIAYDKDIDLEAFDIEDDSMPYLHGEHKELAVRAC